jgi:hypothetical protein
MGILDDAIREHLELKRSHGATEDEIRRKEAEVFGSQRQEAAPEPPAETLDEPTQLLSPDERPEAELEPLEPAPEDPYEVQPSESLTPDPDAPPAAEAGAGALEPSRTESGPPIPPRDDHDEQHPALIDHDLVGGEERAPEPVFGHRSETPVEPAPVEDPPLEPAPIEDPPVGDPPVEFPDTEEPPPRQSHEEASADEDVLEETPEFLQDAPEHDRLWFEQKPPRDFDFGE